MTQILYINIGTAKLIRNIR